MGAGLKISGSETNSGAVVSRNFQEDVFTAPVVLKNGDTVVTWLDPNTGDLFQRGYPAGGSAPGPVTEITGASSGFAGSSGAEALKGGGYAVFWRESSSDGGVAKVALFNDDGSLRSPATTISGAGEIIGDGIAGTTLNNGNLLVTWTEFVAGEWFKTHGRIVKQDGSFAGGEKSLDQGVSFEQAAQDVAGLGTGQFAQVWLEYSGDFAKKSDVKMQLFTKTGAAVGAAVTVNTLTAGDQFSPKVAALKDGGFVVTWWGSLNADGSSWGVFAQRFDDGGTKQGGEFQVNTTTFSQQWTPEVIGLADGGFLVAWQSFDQDGSGEAIVGQRFAANGSMVGDEFIINSSTSAAQWNAGIAGNASGDVVVTWQSHHLGGTQWQVMSQGFDTGVVGTDAAETLRDTNGLNLLEGFGGRDRIFGLNGNDSIFGGNGNDKLDGGNGRDLLVGGRGRDTLIGGAHNDILKGNGGADTFVFDGLADEGRDRIIGFQDGIDHIRVTGSSFANTQIDSFGANGALVTLEGGTEIVLKGITPGQLTHADFDFL